MKPIVMALFCAGFLLSRMASAGTVDDKTNTQFIRKPAMEISLSTFGDTNDAKYMARLTRTAASALVMSVVSSGLYVASDILFFYDHETPAGAMGLTGFGLTAGLSTIFFLSNRSVYRRFDIYSKRPLQVWAWVASGLAMADILAVVSMGYGAAINPLFGMISLAGIFTAFGFTLFAVDSLHARKQLKTRAVKRQSTKRAITLAPMLCEIPFPNPRSKRALIGVVGTFF